MSRIDWLQPIDVNREQNRTPWWVENERKLEAAQRRAVYKNELLLLQNDENPFPNSNEEESPLRTYEEYENALKPYMAIIESDKTDFLEHRASVGHKVHLNVAPENVTAVSRYLTENQYSHKYLSGGEVADGKIFTVYFGSLKIAKKYATCLSQELGIKLLRPRVRSQVEYAPNISGRFVGNQTEFTQYPLGGIRGISSMRELVEFDLWTHRTPDETREHAMKVFNISYDRLSEMYCEYFYGG